MAQITSGVGLISGLNTADIINQLIAVEQQPVTLLKSRITQAQAQKSAYSSFATQLSSLQTIGQALERRTTFNAATTLSSDTNVLTASASAGAAVGSYQFQVAQLVSAQQSISGGYANPSSLVGAGTITIDAGGGDLQSQTKLAQLNGGAGVSRGQFRITDGSGKAAVIDTSAAISLDDVVKDINTSLGVSVKATIAGDHLVLTDVSGGSGILSVQDLGSGKSAQDLGISGATSAGTPLTGGRINFAGATSALSSLNDGRGVRTAGGAADFTATLRDGSTVTVTLGAAQTLGDVVNTINTAGGGKLTAAINSSNNSLTLTDSTGGGGTLSLAAQNGSQVIKDLGLARAASGGVIQGGALVGAIDSTLVSSLNGGSGVPLGQIAITNRSGGSATTVDLSAASSVQDILDAINNSGAGVTASLNASGNGIQLQDNSGGNGNLVVADVNSTTAHALGIAGTFTSSQPIDSGANLHPQYISENSLLSGYNGGKGVNLGTFTIKNSTGATFTVDLSHGTFSTIGDVISAINAKKAGVTASINANGNGLLLTDTSGGAGKLTVANGSGTAATDLNIAGAATGTTIDGAFEKTIAVTSSDTLASVQTKIQQLGFGVTASVVNDGSGNNPYHLSLTAVNSGRAGRVVIDGGATSLKFQNLVQGQDAAVFYGGSGSGNSLLVTSSTNQIANVVPGVTLNLVGVSTSGPVNLTVSRDGSGVATQLQQLTDGFNKIVDTLTTDTKFDTSSNQGGLLLGEDTVQTIQDKLYTVVDGFVAGAGKYRTLADVGITITDGAKLQFDQTKFNAAFAADPAAVNNLFTQAKTGLGALLDQSMTSLVDPVNGVITVENKTLDSKVQGFQDQITSLNSLIADKKARLEAQFANLESVLAGLQSQQSALSSLGTITTPTPSKTTTSSSSTSTSSSSSIH